MPNNATKISEGNVTSFLYDKLMRVFGEGSQLFTMEMPGRTLNQLDYAYDITDHNTSILSKPYAVAEREFRLCDDLFDVSPVVQGPNGVKLSKTYSTVGMLHEWYWSCQYDCVTSSRINLLIFSPKVTFDVSLKCT